MTTTGAIENLKIMLPEPYDFVARSPVIPVMVIDKLADAIPMARALVDGGISALEVTLRTPCALEAIRTIADQVQGADIGAGTVCNASQMRDAVDAGATFIVSPGSSEELFDGARDMQIPLLPGAVTATEVMRVREAGFPVIKFFPAGTSGGPDAIKALQGPFEDSFFVPTGGVTLDNLAEYLRLTNVLAVGGSWILPRDTVSSGDWSTVARLAREALTLANAL